MATNKCSKPPKLIGMHTFQLQVLIQVKKLKTRIKKLRERGSSKAPFLETDLRELAVHTYSLDNNLTSLCFRYLPCVSGEHMGVGFDEYGAAVYLPNAPKVGDLK